MTHDVEEGHLTDRGSHPLVGRRCGECIASTHRGAERRHPLGVDARQPARERDRSHPVLQLTGGVEQVPRAGAVAESAVVEDERGDACARKALRERS